MWKSIRKETALIHECNDQWAMKFARVHKMVHSFDINKKIAVLPIILIVL